MSLPNFIDVVTLTVGKAVTSSYRGGVTTLNADHALRYVSSDAVSPSVGDAVVGQASIGVQRSVKQNQSGTIYVGKNASIIVSSDETVFAFNAAATGTTQINPQQQGSEVNVPQAPRFSTSVFWV